MEQTSPRNGLSEEALLNALFNSRALQGLPTPLQHVHCCSLDMRTEAKQQGKKAEFT